MCKNKKPRDIKISWEHSPPKRNDKKHLGWKKFDSKPLAPVQLATCSPCGHQTGPNQGLWCVDKLLVHIGLSGLRRRSIRH